MPKSAIPSGKGASLAGRLTQVLHRIFRSPPQDTRNAAILRCVTTFGIDRKTFATVLRRSPKPVRLRLDADVNAIQMAIDRKLFSLPADDQWDMDVFLPELQEQFRADFPWLSDRAFRQFQSYCYRMAWHEGVLAQKPNPPSLNPPKPNPHSPVSSSPIR